MQQQSGNMSMRGAVDLAAVKERSEADRKAQERATGADGGASGGRAASLVFDVTEATFESEILQRSNSVPVVVDFWADWCEPCKQLGPTLESLAREYAGRFVLAKLDIEANQQLAQGLFQQLGVQGIPFVLGVVGGQPVPMFQGAVSMEQAREALDQLVAAAKQQFGIEGQQVVDEAEGEAPEVEESAPPEDPALAAAHDALDQGDLSGAAQAYRNVLTDQPGNAEATIGLANAELLLRTRDLDAAKVRDAAAEHPKGPEAQIQAADLDMTGGHVQDAFGRLVETVGRTAGEDRNRVREHLLALFDAVGADDQRVVQARSALARKLF